jgi:hypothetical protein
MAEALCYKPNGSGSSPDDVIEFFQCLILPAAVGPGVHAASNRNEYQKQKKKDVSGTGFCLRFQVEPTQMGATKGASLSETERTMDNVQYCDSYVLLKCVRSEHFTPAIMNTSIFQDTLACSLLKVNGHFGTAFRLHLQDRRIRQE